MGTQEVLGITVDDALVEKWRNWFAPDRQPFRTDLLEPGVAATIPATLGTPTEECRDTFFMYAGTWTWLHQSEFAALPRSTQQSLLAVRRKVMRPKPSPAWRSELAQSGDDSLLRWIERGVRPSRHRLVPRNVWRRTERLLPAAERLAGTFTSVGSGPNCFGNVMAAAGDEAAETTRIVRQPFQDWLDDRTDPVRGTANDQDPGTVLVWTENGELAHAAVTIGDGWVLHKPSQSWSSPRLVWTVTELVRSWRFPGTRLFRRRLQQ